MKPAETSAVEEQRHVMRTLVRAAVAATEAMDRGWCGSLARDFTRQYQVNEQLAHALEAAAAIAATGERREQYRSMIFGLRADAANARWFASMLALASGTVELGKGGAS